MAGQSTLAVIKTQKDTQIFTGGKNISEQKRFYKTVWRLVCNIIVPQNKKYFTFSEIFIFKDLMFYLSLSKLKDCLWSVTLELYNLCLISYLGMTGAAFVKIYEIVTRPQGVECLTTCV